MSRIRLSIIIPNYNYGQYLGRLAVSLGNQTIGLDLCEIIFVDDGSTDDSIKQSMMLQSLPCARFEPIFLGHCGLPGAVRNKGMEQAQGEFIVCIDPDDLPGPDWLACCVAALESAPDAGVAYTSFTRVENREPAEIRLPEFDPTLLANQNILPPAAVIRREVYEKSEGYRTNTTYEDWDFWIQAALNGFGFAFVDQILFVHMVHGQNFSFAAREKDAEAKAAIVLNNPEFFPAGVRHWARSVMAGETWAWSFPRGIIPILEDVEKLLNSTGNGNKSI